MKRLESITYETNSTELAAFVASGRLRPGAIYIVSDTGTVYVALTQSTYTADIKAGYTGSQGGTGYTGSQGDIGYTGSGA